MANIGISQRAANRVCEIWITANVNTGWRAENSGSNQKVDKSVVGQKTANSNSNEGVINGSDANWRTSNEANNQRKTKSSDINKKQPTMIKVDKNSKAKNDDACKKNDKNRNAD